VKEKKPLQPLKALSAMRAVQDVRLLGIETLTYLLKLLCFAT